MLRIAAEAGAHGAAEEDAEAGGAQAAQVGRMLQAEAELRISLQRF